MKKLVSLLPIIFFAVGTATAGIPSNFFAVRDELVLRHAVLGGSEDKDEQKQDKAVVKGIAMINDVSDLADDIKISFKLGKLLAKAFPDEFEAAVSNNLYALMLEGYNNIGESLSDRLDDLEVLVNMLPVGKDREKAEAAYEDALDELEAAAYFFQQEDYQETTKRFSACLKNIEKALKIIAKAMPV
ncbi:MAG: hypothetical protein PCFJNLEI_03747 [Verrucomicrobiae bacterium]|nr:hypothetical protein [Verrucomicrobiae bacterium]